MAKYVKVTDDGAVGYHSVEDDFKAPTNLGQHESYEFVPVAEARKENPGLFGKDESEPVKPTK